MKEAIHPKYHDVEARCACGATWKTRSTKPELHLEICSSCHPFFTGKQKLIDTEGRVERFTKKFGAQTSESRKTAAKATKAKKAAGRGSTAHRSDVATSRSRVAEVRVSLRDFAGSDTAQLPAQSSPSRAIRSVARAVASISPDRVRRVQTRSANVFAAARSRTRCS